jgi:hypothetical protein
MAKLLDLVERFGLPALLVSLICDTLLRACERRFWFDELLSYWMIQLPDVSSMWTAFHSGADPQPFVVFFPFRIAQSFFGPGEAAMRLPSILAFAASAALLCVYVRRSLGAFCGLSAASFLCLTYAYAYAYEARSYALMLCFTALGFVSWRRAVETRPRFRPLIGFGFCLAGMVSTHYYAGLLLATFAVGEIWRAVENRRIDWPVAAAIGAAPLALVPYIPAILAIQSGYQAYSWRTGRVRDFHRFYGEAFDKAWIPLCLAMTLAAAVWCWNRRKGGSASREQPGFARYEIAALIALALSPVAYVLLAMYVTNAYAPRYGIASVFGLACLLAMALRGLIGNRRLGLAAAAGILLTFFAGFRLAPTAIVTWRNAPHEGVAEHSAEIAAAVHGDSLPVLVSDPISFLPVHFYAPEALRSRLSYAYDIEAARRIRGTDSPEHSLSALAPFAPFTAFPYQPFRGRRQEFYVVSFPGEYFAWLLTELKEEGATYEVVYRSFGVRVRRYRWPDPVR